MSNINFKALNAKLKAQGMSVSDRIAAIAAAQGNTPENDFGCALRTALKQHSDNTAAHGFLMHHWPKCSLTVADVARERATRVATAVFNADPNNPLKHI